MFVAGVIAGTALFGLVIFFNAYLLKQAKKKPPRQAWQNIVVFYFSKMGVFVVLLGGLSWFLGVVFVLGALTGMILANVICMIVCGIRPGLAAGLVNDR